jgi:hypothetical protein
MIQHNNLGTLELLATECPFVYGQGVLAARALLIANDGQKRLFVNACELPIQNGAGNRMGGEQEGFVWDGFGDWDMEEEIVNDIKTNSLRHLVGLKAYPNPLLDEMIIEIGSSAICDWFLFDITGRIVIQGRTNQGQTRVDCSGLSSGSYVLRVEGQGQIQLIK